MQEQNGGRQDHDLGMGMGTGSRNCKVGGVKVAITRCEGELGLVKSQENGQLGWECAYGQDWIPIRRRMFEAVMIASESLIV